MSISRSIRTIFLWCHLVAGVTAGLVILVMSVTGVMLAYEKQITSWMDGYHVAAPIAGAKPLSLEELVTHIRTANPTTKVGMVTMSADGSSPAVVRADSGRSLLVDPYTGAIFGEGSKQTRAFFRSLLTWHRWISMTGENRAIGKMLTGVSNILFLFLVLSGFYLWWPSRWTWKVVKPAMLFNWRLRGKPRDFNWHNVIGFWCAPVLFLVVLTGVFISYRWPMQWWDRVSGAPVRVEEGARGEGGGAREGGVRGQQGQGGGGPEGGRAMRFGPPMDLSPGRLDALWAGAQRASGGWQTVSVRLPAVGDKTVTFNVDQGGNGRPDQRVRVESNLTTGAVTKVTTYGSTPYLSRRLQSWVRGVHTGTVLGFLGQTLAMLASLGAVFLVYTGLMLTWRRFCAWRKRKARNAGPETEAAGNDDDDLSVAASTQSSIKPFSIA